MKKLFALFVITFLSLSSHAVTIKVLGKKGVVLFDYEFYAHLPLNVGEVTVLAFDMQKVPYKGNEDGINQIFGIAGNGDDDLEVVSDREMKAHGWCYSLNGKVENFFGNQAYLPNQQSVIVWFYAYAHYKNGKWIAMCVPN